MSRNPYIVDGVVHCAGPNCKAVREATNHWFAVFDQKVYFLAPWKDDHGAVAQIKPVCGECCAAKLQSAYMGRKR